MGFSSFIQSGERFVGAEFGEPGAARGFVDLYNGVNNYRVRLLPGTNAQNYDLIFPGSGPAQYDVMKFSTGGSMVFGKVTSDILVTGANTFSSKLIFSGTDYNTVAWTADQVRIGNTTYNISAGNTGNMTGNTVIYLDTDISTTILQISTNAFDAVGDNKLLLCVAWPSVDTSQKAAYVPRVGTLGLNSVAILANSVNTDALQANSVTAGKISVVNLQAVSAAMGDLVSGSITLTGGGSYFRMGTTPPTSAMVGTGMWIDYTGIYCLKNNVQTVFIDAVNGGIKLKTPTATAGKYIDIGVGTADELQFFEGGVSKVRIGSNIDGTGVPGIDIRGNIYAHTEGATTIGITGISNRITLAVGMWGHALGTGWNYGIYGSASGGTENWAGYFGVGNVYIANQIKIAGGGIGAGKVLTDVAGTGLATWEPTGSIAGGWTDAGTTVRLTTATDNVTIGTPTAAAKLTVETASGYVATFMGGNAGFGTTSPNIRGFGGSTKVLSLLAPSGNQSVLELYGDQTANGEIGQIAFGNSSAGVTETRLAWISAERIDANSSGRLLFYTSDAGTAAANLTIRGGEMILRGAASGDAVLNFYGGTMNTAGIVGRFATDSGFLVFYTKDVGAGTSEKVRIQSGGNSGFGTIDPQARVESRSITEQFRASYDVNNRFTVTVAGNGLTTFDAVGAGAAFTLSDAVTVMANFTAGSASVNSVITENYNAITAPTPGSIANIVTGTLLINNTAAAGGISNNSPAIQLKQYSFNPTTGTSQENSWYVHNWGFTTTGTAGGVLVFTNKRPSDPNTYSSFAIDELGRTLIGYAKSHGSNYYGFWGEDFGSNGIILASAQKVVVGWPENSITTDLLVTGNTTLSGSANAVGTITSGTWQGGVINKTYLATDIVSLGTITTGIWNGTAIAAAYIDGLPASQITSGTFTDNYLATISTAGKVSGSAITSGTIGGSTVINTTGTITVGTPLVVTFIGGNATVDLNGNAAGNVAIVTYHNSIAQWLIGHHGNANFVLYSYGTSTDVFVVDRASGAITTGLWQATPIGSAYIGDLSGTYSVVGHNHSGVYLPIAGTAADSDKLDGSHASAFSLTNHNHSGVYHPYVAGGVTGAFSTFGEITIENGIITQWIP